MMVQIRLDDKACCGCRMCVDVCETGVFEFDESRQEALIREVEDCIACLSCTYLCPSGAIELQDYHAVKNFYRDLEFSRRVERFL